VRRASIKELAEQVAERHRPLVIATPAATAIPAALSRPSRRQLERLLTTQKERLRRAADGTWITCCAASGRLTGRYASLDALWAELLVLDDAAWEAAVAYWQLQGRAS